MPGLAGHEIRIDLATGVNSDSFPANYTAYDGEPCGIDSINWGETRTKLDRTDFKDSNGIRLAFMGIRDGTFSLSGFYVPDDVVQQSIRTTFRGASNAIMFVNITWPTSPLVADAVMCTVTDWSVDGEIDDRVNFSAEFAFTSAPQDGVIT